MCWDENVELSATYNGDLVFPGNSPALQLVAINFTDRASLTVNSFGSWSVTAGLRSLKFPGALALCPAVTFSLTQTNSVGFMTTGQE
jgi:hypothetical protein